MTQVRAVKEHATSRMPEILDDVGDCVDAVLRRVGSRVVLALPLGIGKPNPLVNEFYRRACANHALELTIITALSLLKPRGALGARSAPARAAGRRASSAATSSRTTPSTCRPAACRRTCASSSSILTPGAFLGCEPRAAPLPERQLHARGARGAGTRRQRHRAPGGAAHSREGTLQLSLGSNPDVTAGPAAAGRGARRGGRDIVMVGETHAQMPFMTGPSAGRSAAVRLPGR